MSSQQHAGMLDGQVAIVTGAGHGIGAAIAEALVAAGAGVALVDVDADAVTEGAARLGGVPVVVDVATTDGANAAVAAAVDHWGRVDALVNNAAAHTLGPLHEYADHAWEHTLDHALTSVFTCSRAVLPLMSRQGGGSIVNVASVNHLIGAPHHGAYAAAKGAVVALTRQLAVEYGPAGVRCNCVSPGLVLTERASDVEQAVTEAYPLRRLCKAAEVASVVAFLVSDAASFVTGVDLPVDGGLTVLSPAAVVSPALRRRWGLPPLQVVEPTPRVQ